MTRNAGRAVTRLGQSLLLILWATVAAIGQSVSTRADWPTYGGDLSSTRYSPLDQINAANFNTLDVAWRFKTDSLGPRPEFEFQSTPLVVDGVLYTTGGTRRAAVALDATTGEMLWMHSEDEGRHARLPACGPQREDRRPGPWLRRQRHRRFEAGR